MHDLISKIMIFYMLIIFYHLKQLLSKQKKKMENTLQNENVLFEIID